MRREDIFNHKKNILDKQSNHYLEKNIDYVCIKLYLEESKRYRKVW